MPSVVQSRIGQFLQIRVSLFRGQLGSFFRIEADRQGNEIPASLRQIGYHVTLLEDNDLTPEALKRYDAVIMGVENYCGQLLIHGHRLVK